MANIFPGAKQILTSGFYARAKPNPTQVWSVVHTTANATLSAEGHALAQPIGSGQVTATFWVNRDGSIVQSLANPLFQAPWTNGVKNRPDMTNPRIAACINAGVNPNMRSLVTIENVSREPGSPITAAQKVACARIIAWAHALAGVPVTRETVIGHYQINSVDKPNCPAVDKSILNEIVALANGTVPWTGGGDTLTTYMEKTYVGPRDWTAKGGITYGYKFSSEPNKSVSFAAGSAAQSRAEVTITPTPEGWLAGPYQQVDSGGLDGYLVANSQLNLGPVPVLPPSIGYTQAQLDAAVAAATAASQQALTEAVADLESLEQAVEAHVEVVIKPEQDLLKAAGLD